MTLTAHAVVGAAIASALSHDPVVACAAAFASHFLVDAIPHWDYAIRSDSVNPKIGAPITLDSALMLDVLSIGFDGLLGFALAIFFFGLSPIVLLGAFFGMLPDPLQFVYGHWKHEPLVTLQRFHKWMHTSHHLREHKALGIISQIVFVLVVAVATRFI